MTFPLMCANDYDRGRTPRPCGGKTPWPLPTTLNALLFKFGEIEWALRSVFRWKGVLWGRFSGPVRCHGVIILILYPVRQSLGLTRFDLRSFICNC